MQRCRGLILQQQRNRSWQSYPTRHSSRPLRLRFAAAPRRLGSGVRVLMKTLRVIAFLVAAAIGAFVTLLLVGSIYSSHWTLKGKDISAQLGNKQFIEENFLDLRETHTVNFNDFLSTFTGEPHSALPRFSWTTSIGGFATAYLLLNLIFWVLFSWTVHASIRAIARRFTRRRTTPET